MKKKQENRTTQLAAHRKVDELSPWAVKMKPPGSVILAVSKFRSESGLIPAVLS